MTARKTPAKAVPALDPDRARQPGDVVLTCPMPGCDWDLVLAPELIRDARLADAFGLSVAGPSAVLTPKIEKLLDTHLRTHGLVEIVLGLVDATAEAAELWQEVQSAQVLLRAQQGQIEALTAQVTMLSLQPEGNPVRATSPARQGHPEEAAPRRRRVQPEVEDIRYTADLPSGVVGRKT